MSLRLHPYPYREDDLLSVTVLCDFFETLFLLGPEDVWSLDPRGVVGVVGCSCEYIIDDVSLSCGLFSTRVGVFLVDSVSF